MILGVPLAFTLGILAGVMVAFALSLDEFILTFLVTGSQQTLPLYIFGSLRIDGEFVGAPAPHVVVRPHLAGQFPAAQPRHHHVGQDQVDALALPLAHPQRHLGILRFDHFVAECPQRGSRISPYHRLVLHHQHRLLAPHRRNGLRLSGIGRRVLHPGQIDLERRPAPHLAVDFDVAAALLHDAMDRRQPQSSPFTNSLGGEERFEDVPARLCIHAHAGVAHRQHDVGARVRPRTRFDLALAPFHQPRLNRDLAAPRHRVPRVRRQVWWKSILSAIVKWAISSVMGVRTIRDISSYRVFRAELKQAFNSANSLDVQIDVLLSWAATRFASVEIEEAPRAVGVSNYNFIKLIKVSLLILTNYTTIPLRLASILGFLFTIIGFFVLLYVIIIYFTLGSIPGFSFLVSVVTIFSGVQLFSLGIIGEYLARMFERSSGRPSYVIQRTTGGNS